jgi:glycosyltransferase involved in cell wall biosynthesis
VTQISVVVPAYNEAESIEQLVLDLEREVVAVHGDVEVIVVDDCSTDSTPAVLERLAVDRPWLRIERADLNVGHGPSVVRGLELARGEWIFQLDSDRQFVVAQLSRLWEHREDADLVLGIREKRRDPLHRLLLAVAVRVVVSALAGRRLRDPNVPFRLLRRKLWQELRPLIDPDTLAPSIQTALGAAVRGRRVVEVPVTHLPRSQGTSSLRRWRLVRFSLRGLRQVVAFRLALARAPARAEDRVGETS